MRHHPFLLGVAWGCLRYRAKSGGQVDHVDVHHLIHTSARAENTLRPQEPLGVPTISNRDRSVPFRLGTIPTGHCGAARRPFHLRFQTGLFHPIPTHPDGMVRLAMMMGADDVAPAMAPPRHRRPVAIFAGQVPRPGLLVGGKRHL